MNRYVQVPAIRGYICFNAFDLLFFTMDRMSILDDTYRCRNQNLVQINQNVVEINQNLLQVNPPTFILQSKVNSHKQSRAKRKKKQFVCEMCERKFTSEVRYKNHLNVSSVVSDKIEYTGPCL